MATHNQYELSLSNIKLCLKEKLRIKQCGYAEMKQIITIQNL